MARFYFVFGGLLLVVAIAALFVGISGMDNPLMSQIIQQLHCQPNETAGQVLGPYSYDSDGSYGRSITFHCENSEGQQRDITLPVIVTIAAPFVILLLLSIFAFMRGGMLLTRNLTRSVASYYTQFPTQGGQVSTTVIDLQGQDLNNLPPDKLAKVQQVMDMFNLPTTAMPTMSTTSSSDNLTAKLQQLDDARNKGLITDGEYERVRREILDSLAD